ncbi:MAG TPA: hypothetical protein VHC69_20910 [Polyangiaceae bacterium]|nr:hypothetical protein [Polyangiaceae bacterium]
MRVRRAQGGEAARTFSVVVEQAGAGYRAALDVVDVAGAVNRREVDGADCAEVVSAVALVAALAVDPAAGASPSGAAPVTVAPEATATPPPIAANAPPAPPVVPALREPAPEPRPSSPVRYRWSVGGGGEVRFAVVPAVALGGAIHIDVAPTTGVFVPSFRLSAHAVTTRVERTGITADLTWWSSRWDVCPLRAAASPLVVEACGVLDLGALTTSGGGVERPSNATRFWGAAGFSPRLRWAATPSVELSFESALEFPFRRYELTYAIPSGSGSQAVEFLQMSTLSWDLVLAAAYRFP